MNETPAVALCADDNYLDGLVGTLAGVVTSASPGPMSVVILDCGISDANWHRMNQIFLRKFPQLNFRRIAITPAQLHVFNPQARQNRLNNSAYARLLLPELVPELERIVYLDSDLHVDTCLRPLFSTPLNGCLLGAVADAHTTRLSQNIDEHLVTPELENLPVFNSGVLLMDLAAIRKSDLINEITAHAPNYNGKLQDQGMLNYALKGQWAPLPTRWNRQIFVTENFSIYRDHPQSIWHFIGKMKPWHFTPEHARGLIKDFQHGMFSIGWQPQSQGNCHPLSPAWRDSVKATRASALRVLRGIRPWRSKCMPSSV